MLEKMLVFCFFLSFFVFFQAEDGIRDLVRSRGFGDVYKRQGFSWAAAAERLWAAYGAALG